MSWDLSQFLLIDKTNKVINGVESLKWCGLGGKIKEILADSGIRRDETPHEAMAREFQEETGSPVRYSWHCFMIKEYKEAKIYMMVAFTSPNVLRETEMLARQMEFPEGRIGTFNLVDVYFDPKEFVMDLPYLINMVMREMKSGFLLQLDPEGVNTNAKQQIN